jgi:hypothetical protein
MSGQADAPTTSLADIVAWYDVRDLIVNYDGHSPNLPRAFELAQNCRHEDAKWLLRMFPVEERPLLTRETFRDRLRPYLATDTRAAYFEMMFLLYRDEGNLRTHRVAHWDLRTGVVVLRRRIDVRGRERP